MSASDDRREVAEALRYVSRDELGSGGLLSTWKRVLGVNGTWRDVMSRLADLIDPTCHGIEEREQDGIGAPPRYTSHCSNCGQLWDETGGIPRFPTYCPNCGARVVSEDK